MAYLSVARFIKMTIKHSKYRNPAILFELLVRQSTSDLLNNKESKAVKIIKKYYYGTELGKEYALYTHFNSTDKLSESKAEIFVSTIIEQRKKLDNEKLSKEKYNLIREIKANYSIDNFFKAKIDNYKVYASIYTIFESLFAKESNTKQILENRLNIFEHICASVEKKKESEVIVEELLKEDKEIRLLAYKILVEKFNDKYKVLSDRQKNLLKEYINNISSTENLKKYLNKTIEEIKKELTQIHSQIPDQVTKIRLKETIKLLIPLTESQSVKDDHIAAVLQYMDLIDELKLLK